MDFNLGPGVFLESCNWNCIKKNCCIIFSVPAFMFQLNLKICSWCSIFNLRYNFQWCIYSFHVHTVLENPCNWTVMTIPYNCMVTLKQLEHWTWKWSYLLTLISAIKCWNRLINQIALHKNKFCETPAKN